MRKLAILIFQTLDGVMQAPSVPEEDQSGGFTQGGWARPYWDEVMAQVATEAMADPYDLLLGRNTYNQFAANFADAPEGEPVVDKLNGAIKYVVTSDPDSLTWQNSVGLDARSDIVEHLTHMKQGEGPLLQVHGSWQLIQTLLRHDLIDEFRLWTFPVVAGGGKRLFADGAVPASLQLRRFATSPSGVVMQFYRPV